MTAGRVLMGGGLGLWAARFTTGLAPFSLVTALAPRLLPDPISTANDTGGGRYSNQAHLRIDLADRAGVYDG